MLKLDKLLSEKDIYLNKQNKCDKQWINDCLRNLEKRINHVRAKHDNLINDLHKRVAFDIVQNNDIILLPTFKVKNMIAKKDKRKLRKKTVRSMLSLAHYKFKSYIKWIAKKYGKLLIDVNEAYTSKTIWDGTILNNLGGKKQIKKDNIIVDRDVHGARNILIRFLTKFTKKEILNDLISRMSFNHK